MDALKRRAQSVLNDKSIDAQSRAIIRYAMEVNDPWLARLVRRADAGESIGDDFSQTPDADEDDSSEEKIEALAEMICRVSDESAGALLALMSTIEKSAHPKALANEAKHTAFTRCGELNLYGMVDAQVEAVESELYRATRFVRESVFQPRPTSRLARVRILQFSEKHWRPYFKYLQNSKISAPPEGRYLTAL